MARNAGANTAPADGKPMTSDHSRALRDAFGTFLTGVTVATTVARDGSPLGFTANSFSSVSLDPPLLLVCMARSSRNFAEVTTASGFAINVLAEHQKAISNTFASPVRDRFDHVDWTPGPHGSPVFAGVAAWFDCSMHEVVLAGDHAILIGKVEAFAAGVANGLGYARGAYFAPGLEARAVVADAGVIVSAIIERGGAVLLEDVAGEGLRLPSRVVRDGTPSAELDTILAQTGLQASVGFIYSVYEDPQRHQQHMAYHCTAAKGESALGAFHALDAPTLERIPDSAVREMLKRFENESRVGSYGVYYGSHSSGKVRQLRSGAQA